MLAGRISRRSEGEGQEEGVCDERAASHCRCQERTPVYTSSRMAAKRKLSAKKTKKKKKEEKKNWTYWPRCRDGRAARREACRMYYYILVRVPYRDVITY